MSAQTSFVPAPTARRPLILLACMAASFMAAIEATIMAIAMPEIAPKLGGFGLFAWVFSSYMLAQALTIPVFGRLADIFGRKRTFYIGVGIFLTGSALCGFAPSMGWLVAFRTLQGLGAGGVQPIANTIVGDIYAPAERARIQGALSGVFGIAAILGPWIGATIVSHGSWPLIFWMNIPVGLLAVAMIAVFLQEDVKRRPRRIDYPGALLFAAGAAGLLLLLTAGGTLSGATMWMLGIGSAAVLALLVRHELRFPEPFLPFRLWRNPVILASTTSALFAGALVIGVTVYLPTWLQGVLGRSQNVSGFVLAMVSLTWVIGSASAGFLLPLTTYRRVARGGALAMLAGALMLVLASPERGVGWVAAGALLVGGGMGFCNTTFTVSVQAAVPWEQRGTATSATMFLRFLGQALGPVTFSAAMMYGLGPQAPGSPSAIDRVMSASVRARLDSGALAQALHQVAGAMRHGYALTAVLALAVVLLTSFYPRSSSPRRPAAGD